MPRIRNKSAAVGAAMYFGLAILQALLHDPLFGLPWLAAALAWGYAATKPPRTRGHGSGATPQRPFPRRFASKDPEDYR